MHFEIFKILSAKAVKASSDVLSEFPPLGWVNVLVFLNFAWAGLCVC